MFHLIRLSPDSLTINLGIAIISIAILAHRTVRYVSVNESVIDVISFKQSIITAITGGVITLTATNVISLFGVVIAAVAVFLSILQFLTGRRRLDEAKEANRIARDKILLEEKKLKWEMDRDK